MSDKLELCDLLPLIYDVISKGGEFRLTPNGVSMMPLIRPGVDSVSLVLPINVKKGDVVLYKRDDTAQFVLHRVLDIKKDKYIVCGDNQKAIEYITEKNILAKIKNIYKDGKAIDIENKKYKKYVKKQIKRKNKIKICLFLSKIKHKIFK